MHTNNEVKVEQKPVIENTDGQNGNAEVISYEQCDFQPGRRIPSAHTKDDLARPGVATAVASVFLEKDLRYGSTETCRLDDHEVLKTARLDPCSGIDSKEVSRIETKSSLGTVTCQPVEKHEEKCIERKVQSSGRRRLSNEMLRKTVDTMKHAEGSIKTALSISTITKKEAGKYSFLHTNKSKPAPYVTNFEEPHPSDLDLDLCKEVDQQKPKAPPRLDMKKLEAFFNKPPTPPEHKPKPAQSPRAVQSKSPAKSKSVRAAQSKSKSLTSRKSKSLRFLRVLRTASSAENTEKSGEPKKKRWTLRSKRLRNKPSREKGETSKK